MRQSDKIYTALADGIRAGTYAIGCRLPSENVLASQYGVSRPTLREALARLREDGLVVSRQGSGVYVQNAPAPIKHVAPLANIQDLKRCFEYRIGLETEAARIAATHRTPDDITHLNVLYDTMDRSNAVEETGMEEDYAFHLAVAKASGNRFFVAGLEQVRSHIAQGMTINRTLSLASSGARLASVQTEHMRIIACLEHRDPSGTADAMATHLRNALKRFLGE